MSRLRNPATCSLLLVLALLGLGSLSSARATEAIAAGNPRHATYRDKAPLEKFFAPDLQKRLEATVTQLGFGSAVREKRLGIALVDVTNIARPRYAAINPNEMLYAASLPKIAVLFAAFAKMEAGQMPRTKKTLAQLRRMIRYSSNIDASAVMNQVGKPYIAKLLQNPEYRLYDRSRGGGLWAGKNYGSGGVWRRDPLRNLSHAATPLQAARFYYMLNRGELVSARASAEMLAILDVPGISHKFVAGMRRAGDSARIHRKSGSWINWHSDSALIRHRGRSFILVALCKEPNGNEWLQRLTFAVDSFLQKTDVEGEEVRWIARSNSPTIRVR